MLSPRSPGGTGRDTGGRNARTSAPGNGGAPGNGAAPRNGTAPRNSTGGTGPRGRFENPPAESPSERTMISRPRRGGPWPDDRDDDLLDSVGDPVADLGRARDWDGERGPRADREGPAGGRDALRGGTGPRRAASGPSGRFGTEGGSGRLAAFAEADDDELDDDAADSERPDLGMALFWRRLVIALVWLGFALGLGVGAGVIWEKIRPSADATTAATASLTPTASAPAAAPSPTSSATPAPAVPADWAAYTATTSNAKSTFSHPGAWTIHPDSTAVFFVEPSGPRMVGVARRVGLTDGAAAVSKVDALEFNTLAGHAVTGSGNVKDPISGATVWELTGTYTRQGQKVAYMMHSVDGPGAEYVLIVRVPADSSSELDGLMRSLRASFQPAS
ncbi:hypothetical protein FraEuI1c_7101 [Pseudofrankia inefficax]|uniref:Uncharacterized protein n=2 Tax=Pseudofrankia inefficax (strain DSM 45817 / CECT 9037 / DDB 130130 / EuI1c) TaxID=298654 RepID=E3IYJ5_PSEI1|nr:hypothetical protein FraEuI1c_7101 [Pseudofrankia inefficax]